MNKIYKINHVSINFADRKISSNGVEIAIDHKAVEVLKLLVQHQGETVSNDTFMQEIWTNKPSAPEVIPAAISRLRKVFKQAGISDELIITVHKVGYRYEAPKQQDESRLIYKNNPYLLSLLIFSLAALIVSIGWIINKQETMTATHVFNGNGDKITKINQESNSGVTQIYILRHTEKANLTDKDPELSMAGIARAEYWKKVLQYINFTRVFTTDFIRNIQTANLVIADKKIAPELYYPMSFDVLNFIEQIRGQKVLVIGHSNTIPDMVNRLIADNLYPPMSHQDYNILYVVTINKNGDASSSMLHIEMPTTPFQN